MCRMRADGVATSIGTCIPPAFRIPIMLTIASGDFGMRMQTRSPFLQPASFNRWAS